MWSAVALLDDEDIPGVAGHFAALARPDAAVRDRDPGCAARETARPLFHRGGPGLPACMSCHPAHVRTTPGAGIPYLIGLTADYLERQLRDYASGRRGTGPGAVMRDIASRLSSEELRALSRYVAECVGRANEPDR